MVKTTNCLNGITMQHGWWSGANDSNSQSNHSKIDQCRVYNKNGSNIGIRVLRSNGVVVENCISEGWASNYSLYYDGSNAHCKHFMVRNFHLEHAPVQGGIFIRAQAGSQNIIEQPMIHDGGSYPIVVDDNGPVEIRNVGWWPSGRKIKAIERAPRIDIVRSIYTLNVHDVYHPENPSNLFKGYIRVIDGKPA